VTAAEGRRAAFEENVMTVSSQQATGAAASTLTGSRGPAGSGALAGTTAIVTGASRGFGRATCAVLVRDGARVAGLARDGEQLAELAELLGPRFVPVCGDAADPVTAGRLTDELAPRVLILNAGASPLSRPLHQHTWESFSSTWSVDVRHAFNWIREALLAPLRPGSTVIAVSSGAALHGSALSGGYAGAKAAIRFMADYAAQESRRAGLGIRFTAVLPPLTPATALGAAAVAAYAARAGLSQAEFLAGRGPVMSAEQAGQQIAALAADPALDAPAYRLTPDGLQPLA
jgi:NAD(P)-dependent dehydrogenase (short-subunit alcohol dehydrogenase family)